MPPRGVGHTQDAGMHTELKDFEWNEAGPLRESKIAIEIPHLTKVYR